VNLILFYTYTKLYILTYCEVKGLSLFEKYSFDIHAFVEQPDDGSDTGRNLLVMKGPAAGATDAPQP
jgi:hypothetical protein